MARPMVGQRGRFYVHQSEILPEDWTFLGSGFVVNLPLDIHEYLPDQPSHNMHKRIVGSGRGVTGTIEGLIDESTSLDLTDWFVPGAVIARELRLELTDGQNFVFDAYIHSVQLTRRNGDLQSWTAEFASSGETPIQQDVS